MRLEGRKFTHALIIGNGFDLNLGLKTAYTDFIKSDQFRGTINDGNSLSKHLFQKHGLEQWIDIENELKIYSRDLSDERFEKEYYSVCTSLVDYLKSINYSVINDKSAAYKLIEGLVDHEFLIIDFNYTETVKFLLEQLGLHPIKLSNSILSMHGSVRTGNIIFGVEDKADIKREHIFLKKSFNINFKPIDLLQTLTDVEEIIFFGHSLGETDHMYFTHLIHAATAGQLKNKKFHFYYYKQEGYKDLHVQLDTLTFRDLTRFKQNNVFIPYDASVSVKNE